MNDERTPLSPMTFVDRLPNVTSIGGHRPWDMTGPSRFPGQGSSRISAFYWIGAIVAGSIIWAALIRML
jgi:hypothetical protein